MGKLKYFLPLLLLIFVSCKKTKEYSISSDIKQYFDYHKGSYWIYRNDSTGLFDSTYVKSYSNTSGIAYGAGIKVETINFDYKSKFLGNSYISYVACGGPDYYTLSSIVIKSPADTERTTQVVAYSPNWAPNSTITPNCSLDGIYFYHTKSADTIANIPYQNLIYSEYRTADTSEFNPFLFIRRICFAKNVGIIKYYEFDRHNNINRSYTLIRDSVVQ